MQNLLDDWDTWPDEQQARYAALINYMDSPAFLESLYRNLDGMRVLTRPGVTFTPEQKALIEAMSDGEA